MSSSCSLLEKKVGRKNGMHFTLYALYLYKVKCIQGEVHFTLISEVRDTRYCSSDVFKAIMTIRFYLFIPTINSACTHIVLGVLR